MASKLSTMLYGQLDEVDAALETDCEQAEIRAALQNVIRTLQHVMAEQDAAKRNGLTR